MKRFKIRPVVLPCGCECRLLKSTDGLKEFVQVGDVGICAGCGAWWQMTAFGVVLYAPQPEDWERLRRAVEKML